MICVLLPSLSLFHSLFYRLLRIDVDFLVAASQALLAV